MNWPDGVPLARSVAMSAMTTLRVGGPADVCAPRTIDELRTVLTWCAATGTAWRALGRGSNLLVSDEGVSGVVIRTQALDSLRFGEGGEVVAGAGLRTSVLFVRARERGLGGFECLIGFPASVGGVARMNAGGRWGTAAERIEKVRVVGADGRVRELTTEQCRFGYRTSALADCVVAEVVFRLPKIEVVDYRRRIDEIRSEKARAQPLAERSAGCIFKNASTTVSAGRLVDECGLKGLRVGGAAVSSVHGNFIVNAGGAKALDVHELIRRVRDGVERRAGVRLELEVEVWSN